MITQIVGNKEIGCVHVSKCHLEMPIGSTGCIHVFNFSTFVCHPMLSTQLSNVQSLVPID